MRLPVSFIIRVPRFAKCCVVAVPKERTESILEGMQQAFEFFGCVPREVWWDNPKTVAEN